MRELGKRAEVFGAENLRSLKYSTDDVGRPTFIQPLIGDEEIICGYDQGLGERMFVCDTLKDMQELFDAYAIGGAINIRWYAVKTEDFEDTKNS